ncbi:5873_t:CDS:1, partial [Acaulospora colombiana]
NLRDIFEYVVQETEERTNLAFPLYNCLRVNRTWCRNVVSILWSRPFHLLNRTSSELISVYISGFAQDAKERIAQSGVDTSDLLTKPLTFNYISMLRELNSEYVYASVSQWVNKNGKVEKEKNIIERERTVDEEDSESDEEGSSEQSNNELEKTRRILSVMQEMCSQFFSGCGPLKSLNMSRMLFWNIPNDYLSIVNLPGAREAFSQLDEFTINARNMNKDILPEILGYCDSIKSLDVYSLPFSDSFAESQRSSSLSNFISMQRGLKRVTLSIETSDNSARYGLLSVISSLKSQLNSLSWVKLQYIKNFSNVTVEDIIESVSNVQTLLIFGCTLPNNSRRPLSSKFRRLRRLGFWNTMASPDTISTIISNCEETLKEIQLHGRICLSHVGDEIRASLMNTFSNCSKLERLQLHTSWMNLGPPSEILQELSESLPPSLLHLEIDLICDPDGLRALFERCTLKSLTLGIGTADIKGIGMNDENLAVIREYVEQKGSLEKLVLAGSTITATDQGLDATKKLIKVDRVMMNYKIWD